jgi:ribosomal protein S18 acetylase RimI-like enzyme
VLIRLAGPGDAERVADLTVRAYVAEGLLSSGDRYVDELRDVAARLSAAEVWVAALDGNVVGAVTFCPPGSAYRELAVDGEGEFRMLAVDPDARGRGAARLLVQRCIDRCAELGLEELVICSMPTMTPAHRLYYSLGFSRDESLDWDVNEELRLWGFRAGVPHSPYV